MPRKPKEPASYSRLSVKSQTVLPRAVREALAIAPGDTVRYRITEHGVVIDKAPAEGDDPFATFTEWSGANDDKAYDDL
jgi:antitoxin PrlF